MIELETRGVLDAIQEADRRRNEKCVRGFLRASRGLLTSSQRAVMVSEMWWPMTGESVRMFDMRDRAANGHDDN